MGRAEAMESALLLGTIREGELQADTRLLPAPGGHGRAFPRAARHTVRSGEQFESQCSCSARVLMHFGSASLLAALLTTSMARSKPGKDKKTAQVLVLVIRASMPT